MASVSGCRPGEAGRSCDPAASGAALASPPEPGSVGTRSTRVVSKLLVVRGRESFAALSRQGRRVREGPLTVIHRADATDPRVAFAVGRKVGPAVVRNRLRRRLRVLWRQASPRGGDYLILASPTAASLSFTQLQVSLEAALARLEPAS